jgi:hypothetical protein
MDSRKIDQNARIAASLSDGQRRKAVFAASMMKARSFGASEARRGCSKTVPHEGRSRSTPGSMM